MIKYRILIHNKDIQLGMLMWPKNNLEQDSYKWDDYYGRCLYLYNEEDLLAFILKYGRCSGVIYGVK